MTLAGVAALLMLPLFFPAVTSADEGTVRDKRCSEVIVWRGEAAMKEGVALLQAKQPDLAARYAACVVPQNTRVVFMTGGYESIAVMVIDGPHRGCRGNVESGVAYNTK